MRLRPSRGGAPKRIVLLTIVGTIMVAGSRGSPSPRSHSPLRVRSAASTMRASTRYYSECEGSDDSSSTIAIYASSSAASAATAVAACARGGAAADEPRRRSGGYDDRDYDGPRPRRPSPSRNYDGRGDGDRRRPGPRPGGGDSRGPDRRREGGPRRPPPRGESRDGRYRRYDGVDDFGDGPRRNREFRGEGRDYFDEGDRRGPGRSQPADSDLDDDGKSKKWFSFKKDKAKTPSKDGGAREERTESDPRNNGPSPLPPPPPPPPPNDSSFVSKVEINPAETERTPIHYMFPTAEAASEERKYSDDKLDDDIGSGGSDGPDTPFLDVEEDEFDDGEGSMDRRRRRRAGDDDDRERFRASSPRRDAVTMFMSTRRGKIQVRLGSMIVGAALGGFIGKSLMNDPLATGIGMSSLLLLTGFLRNDYGELSRALGLAFVLTLKRTRLVRKDYPTLPHLKAMIRQGPRKPFPPMDDGVSPWKYEPIYRDDPDFKMAYALLSMALVGSFCGGNVPILPAWIGGIAGALAFASLTTGSNARGDLGRSMGMRIVGLVQLILAINSELRILGKSATVGGLIFDKFMIMDRKHRIKDRIVAICKWGYNKLAPDELKEDEEDERPQRRERY